MAAMYPVVAFVPMQVVFQMPDAPQMPSPPPAAQDAAAESRPKRLVVEAFKKTAICRYYPRCHLGDSCRFAHSRDELRTRPNLTKTRMCAGYFDGRCRLPARKCGFAHGEHDLRAREVPEKPAKELWEDATPHTPSTSAGSASEDGLEFFTEDFAASDSTPQSTPRLAEEDAAAVSDLVRQWVEEIKALGEAEQSHRPAFFATLGECEAALESSAPEVYED
mmetsp:Transcript_126735/g.354851  ORF Transcript_126735/g.354851 Transcript_126735/m.354851 type:complete len:221 (-) Transcript_126735:60-722(-)